MIEQHFGERPAFSLGVEEELMVVDAETLDPVTSARPLIEDARALDVPGVVKTELFACVVELATGVCASAADAVAELRGLRRAVADLAAARGWRIYAAGTHPSAVPEEQEIADEDRYRDFVDYAGSVARRQGVNGLHVHVGMPSADVCMLALERVLPWLPVVLALSANSPYLAGRESGLVSTRAEVLGLLPRHGAPPSFRSYAEWERLVERFVAARVIQGYTMLWWDVRPHPQFGTLEIRIADQPTALAGVAGLVALLRNLCEAVLDDVPSEHDPGARGVYEQNRWAAARFGPRATFVHPFGGGGVSVEALYSELEERIGPIDALAPDACEADRQLAVGRAQGLRAVAADVVERSIV